MNTSERHRRAAKQATFGRRAKAFGRARALVVATLVAACGVEACGSPAAAPGATQGASAPSAALSARTRASRFTPDRFAGRAGLYYASVWGIDSISVKLVESGELVRFSYRVVDPAKAGALHDKQNEATLDDPKSGVSLMVPNMEQVGQLRQTPTPVAGRSYWMTFSNKGRRVARGDRVDVTIGQFRAGNLVVD